MAKLGELEVKPNTFIEFMLIGDNKATVTKYVCECSCEMLNKFEFIGQELWDQFYPRLSNDPTIINDPKHYPWIVTSNADGVLSAFCLAWIDMKSINVYGKSILYRMEMHGDGELPIKLKEIAKRLGVEYSLTVVGE